MITLSEFSAHLALAAERTRPALIDTLTEIGLRQRNLAHGYIGREMEEWPPLADSTVEEKERLGFTGHVSETDPLLRTGEMRDSIEAVVEGTTSGARLEVGSNNMVALYQEMGTETGIPPRPYLSMSLVAVMPVAEMALGKMAISVIIGKE